MSSDDRWSPPSLRLTEAATASAPERGLGSPAGSQRPTWHWSAPEHRDKAAVFSVWTPSEGGAVDVDVGWDGCGSCGLLGYSTLSADCGNGVVRRW